MIALSFLLLAPASALAELKMISVYDTIQHTRWVGVKERPDIVQIQIILVNSGQSSDVVVLTGVDVPPKNMIGGSTLYFIIDDRYTMLGHRANRAEVDLAPVLLRSGEIAMLLDYTLPASAFTEGQEIVYVVNERPAGRLGAWSGELRSKIVTVDEGRAILSELVKNETNK